MENETLTSDTSWQQPPDEQLNTNSTKSGNQSASAGDISQEQVFEIIEKLPKADRKALLAIMTENQFSGPIPPPEILAGYQSILPDAPERILIMAEKEQAHRHSLENDEMKSSVKQTSIGQIMGVCLSGMFGVISLVLGLYGHDWLAGVLGSSTVISLAVIFVLNQRPNSNKNNRNEEIKL